LNNPIVGLELVDAGAVTVVIVVLGAAAGVGTVVAGAGTIAAVVLGSVELTWELWFERIPPAVPPATAARRIKMRRMRINQKVRGRKPQIVCVCVGSKEESW
jgi:hypothetical protein